MEMKGLRCTLYRFRNTGGSRDTHPTSRSRLMPPGRRAAGARQREMWGLLVFRAARSRAGLCAGDLNLLAKGARFHDGR